MKNLKYILIIWGFVIATMFACNPFEEDKPEAGIVEPPAASEMNFTIKPGNDAFHFSVEQTSPLIQGIYQISWDFGNGTTAKGSKVTAYYPLPDNYTITMTIKTNSGSTSITKTITQTETDYSIFNDPKIILLSGGIDALQGKTWALDSTTTGHLGVGPAGSDGLTWWAAAPLAKTASKVIYDDQITFLLNGFKVVYKNNGKSFVKDFRRGDPAYSDPVSIADDWAVKYPAPAPGSWSIEERSGKTFLKMNGATPVFPCFDTGAKDGEYQILKLEENFLELVAIGGDGNAWHYKLIKAGYERPKVSIDVNFSPGSGTNQWQVSFSNINIPTGQAINKITVDFGDGNTSETTNYSQVISNTYMRKGNYVINVVAYTSVGEIKKSYTAVIQNNHPDYVPFLLDMMVTYNDFSEVTMAPVLGQDCSVTTVANPSRVYPNKSAYVGYYTKTNQQWANAYLQLPAGYRFDLRSQHIFRVMVYGKAGDKVLLKLENTDRGGNAWQTGTYDLIYTIQKTNTWEIAEFNMAGNGAGWDWTGDIFTSDITKDNRFNHDFYNVVRIMLNPGVGDGTHQFYFDELSGPHVEGLKSAKK